MPAWLKGWLRRLASPAYVGAALAGCASFHPEPLSPTINAVALDSRTLDDPQLHRFLLASESPERTAEPRWDLDTLTLAALYYHPDLPIARAKLAAAQAGIVTAHQRPNPTLSLGGAYNTMAVAGAFPTAALPLTVGPIVSFLIETAGKREDRTAQAQHLADAARADLATAVWQVRGRVRTALLNLWAARQRRKLAQAQVGLRQKLVALLEQRLLVGFATSPDVTRERVAFAQAALGVRGVERAKTDALTQLATAVGVPVRALDGVPLFEGDFDRPAAASLDFAASPLRRLALTGRSDVEASLAQYEAAQSALQLQVANQYPNLTLGTGYTYDVGMNRFILGPTFDLPIFNQNQGQIAHAMADRQQAAANFTALQAQVIGAIDAADRAYLTATQALGTADALLAEERGRQLQVNASFAAGETDRLALVAAELELTLIQSAQFDAVVSQRQALGALEDALQQPLFDPQAALFVPPAGSRIVTETSP